MLKEGCMSAMLGCQKTHSVDEKILVAFRMDDYSAISDTGLELHLLDLFQKKKFAITFGVVPFVCAGNERTPSLQELIPLPFEKGDLLRKRISTCVLDIALHGYSHQSNGLNELSEFAGLDYDSQLGKLVKGKQFLEETTGNPVNCFVPPWNSYDLNTLRALESLGFETLSAGWKGVAARESKIRFLPATCNLSLIKDAIHAARRSPDKQPVIVVLLHHYDFKELKDSRGSVSLETFSELLDWLAMQKDVRAVSISHANQSIDDLSANRFLLLDRWRSLERVLPRVLREKKPVLIYHEGVVLQKTRFKVCIYYAIIAVLFAISAFGIGAWLFQLSNSLAKIAMYTCCLLTVGIYLYAFKDLDVSHKGLLASLGATGVSAGMICMYLVFNYP